MAVIPLRRPVIGGALRWAGSESLGGLRLVKTEVRFPPGSLSSISLMAHLRCETEAIFLTERRIVEMNILHYAIWNDIAGRICRLEFEETYVNFEGALVPMRWRRMGLARAIALVRIFGVDETRWPEEAFNEHKA
jgi:hypothetical protein